MTMEFKRGPASTDYWSGRGSEPELRFSTSQKEIQFHSTIPSKGGGDTHCVLRIANDEYGETFERIITHLFKADPESIFDVMARAMPTIEDLDKAIEAFERSKQRRIDREKRHLERLRADIAERKRRAAELGQSP